MTSNKQIMKALRKATLQVEDAANTVMPLRSEDAWAAEVYEGLHELVRVLKARYAAWEGIEE